MDFIKVLLIIIAAVILGVFVLTAVQIIIKLNQKYVEDLPSENDSECAQGKEDDIQYRNVYNALCARPVIGDAVVDEKYIMNALSRQAAYVNKRFDCSDFRLQLMFRIYKDCYDKLSDEAKALIKETFLNFKYFMDEPGDDSMCYWSENHQLLFAVSEYLAGQEWENEVFSNSGMTGSEHKKKAIKRINAWIEQRFKYGFSEYLSNVYLQEDIAPMSNFIEYADDEKAVKNMTAIMHLLWFDVASHSVKNRLVPASSRMYGNNKSGNYIGNSLLSSMNLLWGKDTLSERINDTNLSDDERKLIENASKATESCMSINFIAAVEKGVYKLPEIIRNIACDKTSVEIKMSSGLSTSDMKQNGLIGQEPYQIMAQLGAESFTNAEVIKNTVAYLKKNKMFRNKFVFYFKFMDISLLKLVNLEKFAAKHNIMTHGIAIGRGNIYAYRTEDYIMTTLVKKDVDMCGAQDHEWSANIGENLALFSTHPARDDRFDTSPGYWIGNGRRPMSVQDRNVNITVYKIPQKKRLAEMHISKKTHMYFPKCFYDETEHNGNMIFARKGNVLVAVISDGELKFEPFNDNVAVCLYKDHPELQGTEECALKGEFDLVRTGGDYHMYVTELSSLKDESFDDFKSRIKNNYVEFLTDGAVYESGGRKIKVTYSGEFSINDEPQKTEYLRYDSDYCKVQRAAESINISFGNQSMELSLI